MLNERCLPNALLQPARPRAPPSPTKTRPPPNAPALERADGENASASDVVQLRLSEPEWRGVLSMLEGGRELAEEPLEDLQADD